MTRFATKSFQCVWLLLAVFALCACAGHTDGHNNVGEDPVFNSKDHRIHESEFIARKIVQLWQNDASYEGARKHFCSRAQTSEGRTSEYIFIVDKLARRYFKGLFTPANESKTLIDVVTVGAGIPISPDRATVWMYFDLTERGIALDSQASGRRAERVTKPRQWEFQKIGDDWRLVRDIWLLPLDYDTLRQNLLKTVQFEIAEFSFALEADSTALMQSFVAVETVPLVIRRIEPQYPQMAFSTGLKGNVIVRMLVKKDGTVGDVMVVRSSGLNVGFEEAAIQATSQWLFRPAMQHGKPISVWLNMPIPFSLSR